MRHHLRMKQRQREQYPFNRAVLAVHKAWIKAVDRAISSMFKIRNWEGDSVKPSKEGLV